jgi:nicotinic acid mononucleotide adenylyltransferase
MKKGKWKRGRELLDLVSVVIVSRPGVSYALQEDDVTNPRLHFYNVPSLGEVSSTAVRKTTDLRMLREVLEPRVLEYIRERGLYALGRLEGGSIFSWRFPLGSSPPLV